MFEILVVVGMLVGTVLLLLLAVYYRRNPMLALTRGDGEEILKINGDEDIKIAGGSSNTPLTNEDYADRAAAEFLMHKDVGNIEIAGQLGERLACELWGIAQELIMEEEDPDTSREIHQKILLLTFTVNRFIADSAPHTLLGETSLSVFYSKLEELSAILYQHASDIAGFSLYILGQRANSQHHEGKTEEVGRTYALLCGEENCPEKIAEGNHIYQTFYQQCKDFFEKEIVYHL